MKKILLILTSISIGTLFIISAATKIYPMEPFEYQFVDIGVATWKTTPYIARFFIGIEFFLGMLFVFNIALRRFTIKFAIGLLTAFIIYLSYKIYTTGNVGNCGCFGESIKMSPLEGILKNVVLIILCIFLYFNTDKNTWSPIMKMISPELDDHFFTQKNESLLLIVQRAIIPVLLIGSMCLGFFVYPINATLSSRMDKSTINYKVPLELMYKSTQMEKPKINLLKGKHVIAFLSLTCPHCKIAAQKIRVIHKKNPGIPFYFVLNGDKEMESVFFEDTQSQDIPHSLFIDAGSGDWKQVAGFALPIIMYINNSIVEKKTTGLELDQNDIEVWLKK
ncbi:MAG: hypothetical protein U0U67_16680 [Chitinophagales bacterium]